MVDKRINGNSGQKIWIARNQSKQTAESLIQERLRTAGNSVSVEVNNAEEWVRISDPTGHHEDIFMQGHCAEVFTDEVEAHYDNLPDCAALSGHDCEIYVALSYAENRWN